MSHPFVFSVGLKKPKETKLFYCSLAFLPFWLTLSFKLHLTITRLRKRGCLNGLHFFFSSTRLFPSLKSIPTDFLKYVLEKYIVIKEQLQCKYQEGKKDIQFISAGKSFYMWSMPGPCFLFFSSTGKNFNHLTVY